MEKRGQLPSANLGTTNFSGTYMNKVTKDLMVCRNFAGKR